VTALRHCFLAWRVALTGAERSPIMPAQETISREDTMRLKAILAGVMLAAGATAAQAEPVKIRLSYIAPVSNWATMLFQRPELTRHLGKSYTFEAIHFQGTPLLITALNAGELEIANLGFTTFTIAVTNAGMSDLRII
jgi:sulfonate transport system substrate-binding protein